MNQSLFADAEVIHAYSRAQAIADGMLGDVSEAARDARFNVPAAMTATAFDALCDDPTGDEARTPYEILRVFAAAGVIPVGTKRVTTAILGGTRRAVMLRNAGDRVFVTFDHGQDGETRAWALIGPGDTAAPVLTVMLEGED